MDSDKYDAQEAIRLELDPEGDSKKKKKSPASLTFAEPE